MPNDRDADGGWVDRFEGLRALEPSHRDALVRGAQIISAPAGAAVFAPGQKADSFFVLLEGSVRVGRQSDTGREVVLYRVQAGESCVLTTACMLSLDAYSADGVVEADLRAVAIPRDTFDDLIARSPVFRAFVFAAYSRRIADLFLLVDDIVFQRMDVRLAARLLELADDDGRVRATHQALSSEIGTAREVVSRALGEFQRKGWVAQSRGEVRLIRRDAIERMIRNASGG